jgi:histidinol dehydrogenase
VRIINSTDRTTLGRLLKHASRNDLKIERRVRAIIKSVRSGGDAALIRFAKHLDGVTGPIEVSRAEMQAGARRVEPAIRTALRQSARNIARVALRQLPKNWKLRVAPGVLIEQRVEPLARVGCYVPGGRYPLASSLLMTAVPARVAGVRDIIAVCPRPEPLVMAAALEAGIIRLFRVGGAHAIAALAYGTKTIPRVDKIVGPGNRYVTSAKRLVTDHCSIDFTAGPTEIVILAAEGRPSWVAADLVAQAEHDPDARPILLTWKRSFAERVADEVSRQCVNGSVAKRSLSKNGAIVLTRTPDEAIALANMIAPEHLVIDPALARRRLVAGTVCVGKYTAQAAGDYASGSNHVLPTSGNARFRGGLSAADFVRMMSIQRLTRDGLSRLAPTILSLARAEGLHAHANSIEIRLTQR